MWKVLQQALPWLLALFIITQVILPTLLDTPMFWMFKRKAKKVDKPVTELEAELESTKEVVAEAKEKVKETREKVDAHFKSAEELKNDSDNLL